jgi:hypothetical protein
MSLTLCSCLLQQVLLEDVPSSTPPAPTKHISVEANSIVAALEAAQQDQQQQQCEPGPLAVKGSRSNSPLHSAGGGLSGGWSQLTQQHLQELQQQLNHCSAADQPAAACLFCDGTSDSAQQLCRVAGAATGCGRQGCPAAQRAFYGEMHDSSGSVPYVGMTRGDLRAAGTSRSEIAAAAGAGAAGLPRVRGPPRRAASFGGSPPAASAMAGAGGEGPARRLKSGPKRSVSFRLEPSPLQPADAAAAAAAAGASSSQPVRRWPEAGDAFADDASVCSAATMATWVSGSTQCTGTSCSSNASGSITEAEKLFNMTGGQPGGSTACGLCLPGRACNHCQAGCAKGITSQASLHGNPVTVPACFAGTAQEQSACTAACSLIAGGSKSIACLC